MINGYPNNCIELKEHSQVEMPNKKFIQMCEFVKCCENAKHKISSIWNGNAVPLNSGPKHENEINR